ncbi:beta-lactamase family protein [Pyxidicoccus fallax]|uniref:Beta-lactamase family protein n=1 Tax=Pyxidicoccus fallax TaxID=394095 RepID=A0A848LZN4_9BACT|nr:serine hydrolase domain-containing protein [Pyxidicoccus fallax]NMO23060.1 beta-lactamase family protein [Pyxidicoccus fallax]NPC85839.1 beta-lactamase family protein [Pyxidicoccus fallax]
MPSPSQLIEEETRRYVRGYRSAALCVGLTVGGEHHVRALRGKGAPPASDALFAVGELTQVFTGALLALMVERGELRLDTPLADLIPRALLTHEAAGRITLEQLATHTSGMPHLPPNLDAGTRNPEDPFGHYSAGLFGDFLRGYQPAVAPPRPYSESLLGMGVLGHALSRRAGLNYGHALRDLLFKPLGLTDTTTRVTDEQQPRLSSGHTARGKAVPAWTFPALPGAGALHSTAPDLLRFLDANLGRGEPGIVQALKLAQVPRAEAGAHRMGLGWTVSQVRGHTVVWRSSVMGGYTSFLGFAPAADAGVVLLSDHGWSLLAALRGRVPLEAPGLALLTRLTERAATAPPGAAGR